MKRMSMTIMALAFITALVLGFSLACSPETLNTGCNQDEDCYDGYGCNIVNANDSSNNTCLLQCTNADACPTGYACNNSSLCEKDASTD